ncbi:hypothetical protein Ndes2437B_g00361 [Nannochloris sp. 'desiccata']
MCENQRSKSSAKDLPPPPQLLGAAGQSKHLILLLFKFCVSVNISTVNERFARFYVRGVIKSDSQILIRLNQDGFKLLKSILKRQREYYKRNLWMASAIPLVGLGSGPVSDATTPKPQKSSLSPSDVHVLLVDDERLSRTVVSSLLRRCNYTVTTAENGAEAMDLLRSNEPGTFHLVLTDVCMPEVDGIQLLQYVKQEENLRSVPVIMMSSIDKGDTVFECVSSGAEEYLVKPVTRKEVQHMWQHVLRKRSALATVPQAISGDAKVITTDGPSTSAENNNTSADLHDISRASHRPVTAPLRNLQKKPAAAAAAAAAAPVPVAAPLVPAADLEGAKQFLLLMRQARQAEAAKIQRQLAEIELDISVVGGKRAVEDAPPSVKRQRTSTSSISNATTNSTITNWTAISSRLDSLEPLYFDRRRNGTGGNSVSALDSLARDLNVLSQSNSLEVCASLRAGDIASPQEMVCCADFAADDRHFATVSVSRSVKVFDFEAVLSSPSSLHVPVWQATTRSKLSSVSWNAYVRPHLLTSDYDGLIQLWDASAGPSSTETAQFEEHSRRVWSVDFSRADPMRFVSGSDDATVRLWSVNQDSSATVMRAPANVCSVQFSPTNGNLVAAGCANHRVYMYDLRKANTPAAIISGPNRAVSYVRFMGPHSLVAASTDNTIRVWDVEEALTAGSGGPSAAGVALPPRCVFTGHRNERNFVGLSATDDGYIATGSEDNSIHTYYKTLPFSVASHRLGDGVTQSRKNTNERSNSGSQQPSSSMGTSETKKGGSSSSSHRTFVSSVCWARGGRHCLAANSQGVLSVLHLK